MYPTIYHAVKDLFGSDIIHLKLLQSFGFFVAIAFLLCAFAFAHELRRKAKEGLLPLSHQKVTLHVPYTQNEMLTQAFIGFILGWKLVGSFADYASFSQDPRGWILSGNGSLVWGVVVAGVFYGWCYLINQRRKNKKPEEKVIDITPADDVGTMTLIAAGFGFLGAKLFHILENFGSFLENPGEMLFSFSGLTMYGGLILGSVAVLYYARKKGYKLLHVMDACAPGLFLAYGVGRLGCQVAGDGDWGIVNTAPKPGFLSWAPDWLWRYDYPNNVNGTCNPNDNDPQMSIMSMFNCDPAHPKLIAPVFPTPLYEAVTCILLFCVFWYFRKRFSTPGLLFATYMIVNGVERFFIELIRVDTTLFWIGSFRVVQAQFIAFCLIISGIGFAIWTKKRKTPSAPVSSPPPPPETAAT